MYYQPPCNIYAHNSLFSTSSYTAASISSNSISAPLGPDHVGGGLRGGPSSSSVGVVTGGCIGASSTSEEKEVKGQFLSPEGVYRMTVSEFYRPSLRTPLNSATLPASNAPSEHAPMANDGNMVAVNGQHWPEVAEYTERICFNVGREIYVFEYGATQVGGGNAESQVSRPVDKRIYKGTFPTCHDFNKFSATVNSCALIIGFSAGQIQMIDPYQKEYQSSKLFNEDRLVDKTAVTCLRWIPGESSTFITSHASGNLYVYNEEFAHASQGTGSAAPSYQLLKQGDGYSVFATKSKTQRNPLSKWQVGELGVAVNQLEFSPGDGTLMAVACQDGFLRLFNYGTMELVGYFKSYFGGILCLAWSPNSELIATGGEDDMLTVYSLTHKRVLCRGQGHKSWIAQVAFDPYNGASNSGGAAADSTIVRVPSCSSDFIADGCREAEAAGGGKLTNGDRPLIAINGHGHYDVPPDALMSYGAISDENTPVRKPPFIKSQTALFTTRYCTRDAPLSPYRIGTVGHDTQLCLWDLPLDVVGGGAGRANNGEEFEMTASRNAARNTTIISIEPTSLRGAAESVSPNSTTATASHHRSVPDSIAHKLLVDGVEAGGGGGRGSSTLPAVVQATVGKSKFKKLHRRGLSFGSRLIGVGDRSARNNNVGASGESGEPMTAKGSGKKMVVVVDGDPSSRIFGTAQCPRMDEVLVVEPIVCKKIAHERLTALHFREDCIVTASQDGLICTWARPGRRDEGGGTLRKAEVRQINA